MKFRSIRSVPKSAGLLSGILGDLKQCAEELTGQRGNGEGFDAPAWNTWIPEFYVAVLNGYSTARYIIINSTCYFSFTAEKVNLSGAAGAIKISLPAMAKVGGGYQHAYGAIFNGSAWLANPFMDIYPGTNIVNVYKTAAAGTWLASETGICVRINGFYEVD